MKPTSDRPPEARLLCLARQQARKGLAVLVLLAMLGTAIWHMLPRTPDQIDRTAIEHERSRRVGIWKTSLRLPGTPDLDRLDARLAEHGLQLGAPVMVRVFKREFELELWMVREGRYHLFATYPICRWSGNLGPKLREGDRQAPEGFYLVDAKSLNAESRWHRSFNLGFPNAFDKAHARTGSFLMVHGGCSSVGCFAMTDAVIDEIWKLVTAALKAGQPRFQVQVYPFRLTSKSLARYQGDARLPFWHDLKRGSDAFEASWLPPRVSVCRGRYAFAPAVHYKDGSQPIGRRCDPDTERAG
jgi:murein L,D-transpeptidase YafK